MVLETPYYCLFWGQSYSPCGTPPCQNNTQVHYLQTGLRTLYWAEPDVTSEYHFHTHTRLTPLFLASTPLSWRSFSLNEAVMDAEVNGGERNMILRHLEIRKRGPEWVAFNGRGVGVCVCVKVHSPINGLTTWGHCHGVTGEGGGGRRWRWWREWQRKEKWKRKEEKIEKERIGSDKEGLKWERKWLNKDKE